MDPWSHEVWNWRMNCRLNQRDGATVAGVSVNTISRWENGHCEPPEYVKERVRKAYDLQYMAYLAARDAMKH